MAVKGIFVITIGQWLGWVRDYFQSYSAALYAQNLILFLIASFWIPELIYERILERRRKGYLPLCCE